MRRITLDQSFFIEIVLQPQIVGLY
ncbi:hypothetical protein BpHYR1_012929 [Brachionus plicatilis]|uniref:Uncharacterized protein n=1 Tax=Brachionus plicatilis TaxID=10195 RepID=A0A3M7PIW0_BRAPC|nr:hypothetical protein BpHYR1_012929 [Brachionus plicatilis]